MKLYITLKRTTVNSLIVKVKKKTIAKFKREKSDDFLKQFAHWPKGGAEMYVMASNYKVHS